MSTSAIPPLPAGYTLDQPAIPPLPPGYTLDAPPKQKTEVYPPGATVSKGSNWMDSVADFAKSAFQQVNPVTAVQGLAQMGAHPIDTATAILKNQDQPRIAAEQAFKNGDYATGVRHVLNYLLPIIGPTSDQAGDLLQNGQYAKGAGETTGMLANIFGPGAAKAAIAKAAPAASFAALLGKTPAEAYESALKPSTTMSPAARANIVQTGLREGIPVSANGVEKIGDLIGKVNAQMDAAIPKNSPATVNKFAVASRLGDVADRFKMQVNPESDLNAVSESGNEFLRNHPGEIPVNDAAAIKSGTYRQIGSKQYGELGTAATESQKALARGIKEELITQFPELQSLGIRDQQLLQLQPALEKAVSRIGNHQIIGIGTPVAMATGKLVTGSSSLGAVAGVIKGVMDNPAVKSRLAIALNKAGVPQATALQRMNAYHAALAGATLQSAHGLTGNPAQSPDQSTNGRLLWLGK